MQLASRAPTAAGHAARHSASAVASLKKDGGFPGKRALRSAIVSKVILRFVAIKCPKCSALIDAAPDELGLVTCEKCGTRLRSKQPVKVSVSGGANSSSPSLPRIDPKDAAPADVDHVLARLDTPSPDATIRPGSIPRMMAAAASAPASGAVFDMLLTEIRAIKKTQEEILGLLRAPAVARIESPPVAHELAPPRPVARTASRAASVLIIDDDAATREEAAGALRSAGRVKTAENGNSALAAITTEKPAAIVLELDLGGAMPGRDLVNMIKATMDWVDIPIVIHTRLELGDEEEAKHEHGADAIVAKRAGSGIQVARAVGQLLSR